MKGDKETVSIIVDLEISKTLYRVKEYVVKRPYGPFTVDIPKELSIPDIYKFALFIIMKTNVTFLSGEHVTAIGAKS